MTKSDKMSTTVETEIREETETDTSNLATTSASKSVSVMQTTHINKRPHPRFEVNAGWWRPRLQRRRRLAGADATGLIVSLEAALPKAVDVPGPERGRSQRRSGNA
ncbi:hypothetical protein F441_23134 [Phytophthora nicotianae CJ01A1]|uniref:Uncharacterized protein n=1 Tax=Phytophthora nicotianae CJ01A1 TaxID=1317063 RepID=W2VMQ3_PHYNI|nr:hypothetical protein F441_23134 [Phytophthora nicotianae CJ01A1]